MEKRTSTLSFASAKSSHEPITSNSAHTAEPLSEMPQISFQPLVNNLEDYVEMFFTDGGTRVKTSLVNKPIDPKSPHGAHTPYLKLLLAQSQLLEDDGGVVGEYLNPFSFHR